MTTVFPILRADRLTKAFGGVQALSGVSFEFRTPGIVAIIGPNGAGKTTLLNILTGHLRGDSGRFFFGPHELTRLAPFLIARLGVARTFQELRLVTLMSVVENVMLARTEQKGERIIRAVFRFGVTQQEASNRDAAMNWLRFVGLEENAEQPAGELSYGQQKLLTLACCLAAEAPILLLDEPVAGVHPGMIAKILGLLRKLGDSGKLVIFVEHDIAAVRQIADCVIVMDQGKIIAQGRPQDVLEKPEIIEAYVD